VLDPLKVVIDNLPEDHEETIRFPNHPKDESFGERTIPFSREVWIERGDFAEVPPRGFRRLKPDGEVRLRGIGIVKCVDVVKDDAGAPATLHVTLDPDTRPGCENANRKVKGTIHWVSAEDSFRATVHLYDRLFNVENPSDESAGSFKDNLNPNSLVVLKDCLVEGGLANAKPGDVFQFMRQGYFCVDKKSNCDNIIFNLTVALNSSWGK